MRNYVVQRNKRTAVQDSIVFVFLATEFKPRPTRTQGSKWKSSIVSHFKMYLHKFVFS